MDGRLERVDRAEARAHRAGPWPGLPQPAARPGDDAQLPGLPAQEHGRGSGQSRALRGGLRPSRLERLRGAAAVSRRQPHQRLQHLPADGAPGAVKGDPRPPAGWTRRRWLRALPGTAATVAATAGITGAGTAAGAPQPGSLIEWPALVAPDGRGIDPAAWQGVPVVVVFWATYCAFCLRHNAHIEKLHRTLDPARLRVLSVALDRDPAAVQLYLRRHGYGFPVALDGGLLRLRFTSRRVIPMTCTVGADGRLLQCIPGEMAEADVMELGRLALVAAR
ncbi:MAG: hypothetical protein C0505_08265 [Leptothrix sp. (in: Bacteria)]|nr:hypothetical protein [Leptothrix sp. (in: b-proteobacteria)]